MLEAEIIRLQTERMELVPLTPLQLEKLMRAPSELERELMCTLPANTLRGLEEIVSLQLAQTRGDRFSRYAWHTLWLLLRRYDRTVVGTAAFKGVPVCGEVELGYGLTAGFCGHGYMRECVRALCRWAVAQEGVHHVTADAAPENTASRRLLEACGFREFARRGTIWYRF